MSYLHFKYCILFHRKVWIDYFLHWLQCLCPLFFPKLKCANPRFIEIDFLLKNKLDERNGNHVQNVMSKSEKCLLKIKLKKKNSCDNLEKTFHKLFRHQMSFNLTKVLQTMKIKKTTKILFKQFNYLVILLSTCMISKTCWESLPYIVIVDLYSLSLSRIAVISGRKHPLPMYI